MVNKIHIGIIGLGYVGLPLCLEFGRFFKVVGYDNNLNRLEDLKKGIDKSKNIKKFKKKINKNIVFSKNINNLKNCNVYIITVPTPINKKKKPDLKFIKDATKLVAKVIQKNDIIIFESTVYPGATEEICVPILEKYSGLKYINEENKNKITKGFFCGYSPERINPGDQNKTLSKIIKITSGSTYEISKKIDEIYRKIISAGTHRVDSIKVAEAAKVIENTQRDINIALINELTLIFQRLNIDVYDVLNAAETKWNFLPFKPGLVGGHCIGVDPYYLKFKSESVGYIPNIISSGRKINDKMAKEFGKYICVLLKNHNIKIQSSKILIMGFTFKENCSDIRNTKVYDLYKFLYDKGCKVHINDPWADSTETYNSYKVNLLSKIKKNYYDAIIFTVPHRQFLKINKKTILSYVKTNHLIVDLKNIFPKNYNFYKL